MFLRCCKTKDTAVGLAFMSSLPIIYDIFYLFSSTFSCFFPPIFLVLLNFSHSRKISLTFQKNHLDNENHHFFPILLILHIFTGTSKFTDCERKDIRSTSKAKDPLESCRSTCLDLQATQATCATDFR